MMRRRTEKDACAKHFLLRIENTYVYVGIGTEILCTSPSLYLISNMSNSPKTGSGMSAHLGLATLTTLIFYSVSGGKLLYSLTTQS